MKGEGQVGFIVIKDGAAGEVEIELPGPLPHLAAGRFGDARAVPGVVEVELV